MVNGLLFPIFSCSSSSDGGGNSVRGGSGGGNSVRDGIRTPVLVGFQLWDLRQTAMLLLQWPRC
jgi:hypothetical protein